MGGLDFATIAVRDSLAILAARPPTTADVADRAQLATRSLQHAVAQPRLVQVAAAPGTAPATTYAPTIPARVQATLAADRALFTVMTAGRQSVTEQANLMVSENAATFVPFTALLGSSVPTPALPTSRQMAARRAAARETAREAQNCLVQAKVRSTYNDPRLTPAGR